MYCIIACEKSADKESQSKEFDMNKFQSVYTTLALVTDQFACERIIKSARLIADLSKTELIVLSVMRTGAQTNPAALEHLFSVAKEYSARMTVEFSDNPQSTIVHLIHSNHVINTVTGIPESEQSILVRMWETLQNISFFTVTERGELHEVLDRKFYKEPAGAGL